MLCFGKGWHDEFCGCEGKMLLNTLLGMKSIRVTLQMQLIQPIKVWVGVQKKNSALFFKYLEECFMLAPVELEI